MKYLPAVSMALDTLEPLMGIPFTWKRGERGEFEALDALISDRGDVLLGLDDKKLNGLGLVLPLLVFFVGVLFVFEFSLLSAIIS